MFQTKVADKIKTHILYSITFFPKIVPFMGQCGMWYSRTGHNIIRRMRFERWITRVTHTEYCFSAATMVTRTRCTWYAELTLPVLLQYICLETMLGLQYQVYWHLSTVFAWLFSNAVLIHCTDISFAQQVFCWPAYFVPASVCTCADKEGDITVRAYLPARIQQQLEDKLDQ